jgi:hypothetical protein
MIHAPVEKHCYQAGIPCMLLEKLKIITHETIIISSRFGHLVDKFPKL